MIINFNILYILLWIILIVTHTIYASISLKKHEILNYRQKVIEMFYHAYDNYLKHASDYDELKPLSCQGMDTWGSFSLSLIDSLDTLAVIGNYTEFRRVAHIIISKMDFNSNINVSVFETNIRVIGGLLSAHLLSYKAGMELEPGWPCSGPLLRLAENAARRLLPAFETDTGMPYGTVNLKYGVPQNETPITCTAGVGTFLIEFSTLSHLTGDPIFQEKALKAIKSLHNHRSKIGLLGNHINVQDGKWIATEFGIGAGVDSYFEYLVKGAMLLQMPELMQMFYEYYDVINKYVKKEDWYVWVTMNSGTPTMAIFQSLEAFWPSILSLVGDIDQAKKSLYNYHQVWKQYGFVPEFYDIPNSRVTSNREGYPLRPEFIESVFYLYKATRDPHLLQIGADVIDSIYYSAKTECGYATVKNVDDHTIEDRMESFFLAETLKYLYLLFDDSNFIYNDGSKGTVIQTTSGECIIDSGGYVFNSEAHPVDIASVYCCSSQKTNQDSVIFNFQDNLNLYSVLNSNTNHFNFFETKHDKTQNSFLNKEVFKSVDNENTESSAELPIKQLQIEEPLLFESINENVEESVNDNVERETPEIFIEKMCKESEINNKNDENSDPLLCSKTQFESSVQTSSSPKSTDIPNESATDSDQTNKDQNPSEEIKEETNEELNSTSSSENEVENSVQIELPESMPSLIKTATVPTDKLTKHIEKILDSLSDNENNTENCCESDVNQTINQFELLLCPSQSFLQRFSLFGQMIVLDTN